MPKLLRVHAAHAYIKQPLIQNGYNTNKGGLGTVSANTKAQPTLHAQAKISTTNRIL